MSIHYSADLTDNRYIQFGTAYTYMTYVVSLLVEKFFNNLIEVVKKRPGLYEKQFKRVPTLMSIRRSTVFKVIFSKLIKTYLEIIYHCR